MQVCGLHLPAQTSESLTVTVLVFSGGYHEPCSPSLYQLLLESGSNGALDKSMRQSSMTYNESHL